MIRLSKLTRALLILIVAGLLVSLPAPPASSLSLIYFERVFYALTADGYIITFDPRAPGGPNRRAALTGLRPGESVLAIDVRPSDGRLYGLGSGSRLYVIDPATGAATQVGNSPFTPALEGTEFGFDFEPGPEVIRVVSDADQNLRLNPDTGEAAGADAPLNYAAGDAAAGANPNVVALNYVVTFERGVATAARYGIDSDRDTLVVLTDPAAGTLRTLSRLGADAPPQAGFASSPSGSLAFALMNSGGGRSAHLYHINLSENLPQPGPGVDVSGSATFLSSVASAAPLTGLAIAPTVGTFQFSASTYSAREDQRSVEITIMRDGDISHAATVDYVVRDCRPGGPVVCEASVDEADPRRDFSEAIGTLIFAPGVASRTFPVLLSDDSFVERDETVTLALLNPTGNFVLGLRNRAALKILDNDDPASASAADNPIDDPAVFVHQHYHDFLARPAEPEGFNSWLSVLQGCGPNQGGHGAPAHCDRIEVSSGFYRSPEFFERGYYIYRLYEAALGRKPRYTEFIGDVSKVGGGLTAAENEARRDQYAAQFMARDEFVARYGRPGVADAAAFVAALETAAGVGVSGRDELISRMAASQASPAQTLRAFAETTEVAAKFFNRGFVTMQYFGYLRRDPEETGFNAWLDVLSNGRASDGIAPNDYRVMITGFINSTEYRSRFGRP